MNIGIQRTLDRLFGIPICFALSIVDWLRRREKPTAPRAILVVLLSEAGSMVCTQPMLRALKTSYPEASLHVMVLSRNRPFVELLGLIVPERIIAVADDSFRAFVVDSWRAIRRLRALRIDTVIDCELFARVTVKAVRSR